MPLSSRLQPPASRLSLLAAGARRETPRAPIGRRRRAPALAGAVLLLLAAVSAGGGAGEGRVVSGEGRVERGEGTGIQPGTVLATRNAGGEKANTTPGSERNHVAVVGPVVRWPDGHDEPCVIEAQGEPVRKVIAVPLSAFWARYPDIKAYRLVDEAAGLAWARAAAGQLGKPYQRLRANCVTLLRTTFPGDPQRWKRPDHVVAGGELLWQKLVPDAEFTPPADPWAGMTTDKALVLGGSP